MGDPSNAVFISYRRDVGGMLAMALYQNLAERDVDAFYDIESIRAGQFDRIILNQIAARPYFVLVLTPGTLDRCDTEADWLRREIEQALATRRVVVPVHTPSFDFADLERFLPEQLAYEVGRFNGLELTQRWFKYAVQQLVDEFLIPIDLETADIPDDDRAIVERMQKAADAEPSVTERQLTAQQYAERAIARPPEDLEGRIADYSEAIKLDPSRAVVFNNRGIARQAQGDLAGAVADYSEALRRDPTFAAGFYNRGSARHAQGDAVGALEDYSEAIRLDDTLAHAFNNRGVALVDQGDLVGAVEDHSAAIRLDPAFAAAFYNRGNARRLQGDLAGAVEDYSEAIRLDPDYAKAFNNRGHARRAMNDESGAAADFAEARRLGEG